MNDRRDQVWGFTSINPDGEENYPDIELSGNTDIDPILKGQADLIGITVVEFVTQVLQNEDDVLYYKALEFQKVWGHRR